MPSEPRTLKPLPLSLALLCFGIPALIFVFCVYVLIPFFINQGMTEFMSYSLALLIPLILMLIASLVALRLEGYPVNWASIQERFRLRRMDRNDWLWTVVSLLVMFIGTGIFSILESMLIHKGIIPLPAKIPTALLDPTVDPKNVLNVFTAALGSNYKGNWGLVVSTVILLIFNIFGEEFWWRGVILPRQELVHGKNTWLIHGTLWALFHAFKYWSWLSLLPVTLALSFVAQRRKNTVPGIITHFIFNGIGLIPLIALILR